MFEEKIHAIQEKLLEERLDGWLLYDNHGSNCLARNLLEIPQDIVLTRRFFYWIPSKGMPIKLLHRIEEESLPDLVGQTKIYLSWSELEQKLGEILKGIKTIAMEYSARNANPYISMVDAGTIEVVRGCGVEITSSADILQQFTSVLNEKQIRSHKEAMQVLEKTAEKAWDFIACKLRGKQKVTEYDVQKWMLKEFEQNGCWTEEGPVCSVGVHSAFPHYLATERKHSEIQEGDWILLDLWCKKKEEGAVYADITRVAVADKAPTARHIQIFEVVKLAQETAANFIKKRLKENISLKGCEVDDACRSVIKEKGFASFFTHRTGHSIDTRVHGSGAHFDNLETKDERKVLPGMCFSIEPGIYLPNEFGVRLESNILIGRNKEAEMTDSRQKEIVCLFR